MTVYLDVLLLTNLWTDYALLYAVSALTCTPLPALRGIGGAGIGALSALLILLPELPMPLLLLLRVTAAMLMTAVAFGLRDPGAWLRRTGLLLLFSLFFCGVVYAAVSLMQPAGLLIRNAVIYADVSLLTLLLCTAAAAGVSTLLARRTQKAPCGRYRLHLRVGGHDLSVPAIADSGDLLQDAFTGKPVAVCPASALTAWLSGYPGIREAASHCRSFRLMPVRTVTGTELLPVFAPESAAVSVREGERETPVALLVAVTEAELPHAVIPAVCLRSHKGGNNYGTALTLDQHAPALAAKRRQ